MKHGYKLIAFVLLSSLFFASCAESADKPAETETVSAETAEEITELDSLESRRLVSDGLPNTDCEGREYRILCDDYVECDYHIEEMNGDVVDDAVFERNQHVCERFNIDISVKPMAFTDIYKAVSQSINAMDNTYDLVSHHQIEAGKCASSKYYANWYEIEYVNPERPWWNKASFANLSIGGRAFISSGDMNIYTTKSVYCMYLNKVLAENYNITEINDTVLNGEWTVEKLDGIITDSWVDLNGNGKSDREDYYGLVTNNGPATSTYIYSFAEITVSKDSDDIPYLDMNQEKFADMVNAVYDLLYDSNGTYYVADNSAIELFKADRALFSNNSFAAAFISFREMESDYAIIPYPKWNEEQTSYYSMPDGSSSLMGIPITNTDFSFVGLITEAMNAESWKYVTPAAYDVALKVKFTRDEESVAMVDMIFENQVIDLGYIYADYSGIGFTMSDLISTKKNNFSSYYAKNEKAWNRKIDKLVSAFTED